MNTTNTTHPYLLNDTMNELLDGFIVCDAINPGHKIIQVSRGFTELTGYTEAEILGRSCHFLQGKATSGQTVKNIKEALNKKQKFRGKILNYRKDNSPFWNYLRLDPICKEGRLVAYVGIQTDISELETDRQTKENTLQSSVNLPQDIMQAIINSGVNGVFVANPQGEVIDVDESFAQQLNAKKNDPHLHFDWQQHLHPGDKQRVFDAWMAFVNNPNINKQYQNKFRTLTSNNHVRYFSAYASPIIRNNAIHHYIGYTIELTKELEQQAELTESNHNLQKYQLLIDNLRQGNWVALYELSTQGELIDHDNTLPSIVGHHSDYIQNHLWTNTIHPDDKPAFMEQFSHFISSQSQHPVTLSCRVIGDDNEIRYVKSITVPLIKNNAITGYHGALFSLTDQIKTADQRNLYKKILDEMKTPITITEMKSQRLTYLNHAAQQFFNVHPDKVRSITIQQCHPDEAYQHLINTVIPKALTDEYWKGELTIRPQETHHTIPTEFTLSTHTNHHGDVEFLSAIVRDLTQEKKLAYQEEQHKQQINKLLNLTMVQETATSIAHQLNQPLTVASAMVQLWQTTRQNDPARHPCLPNFDLALRALDNMNEIIHSINDLFQARQSPQQTTFNLASTLKHLCEHTIKHHPSILIDAQLTTHHLTYTGNETLIEQAIKNLINNAVDAFTDAKTNNPRVEVSLTNNESLIFINIIDNGPGIEPAIKDTIFDAFFTTKKEGTGIGLALIRRICESEGGHIECVTEKDQTGAHFRLRLPKNSSALP